MDVRANSTCRASFLLNELREEQRKGERCELPDMKIGDAIEVTVSLEFLPSSTCLEFLVGKTGR